MELNEALYNKLQLAIKTKSGKFELAELQELRKYSQHHFRYSFDIHCGDCISKHGKKILDHIMAQKKASKKTTQSNAQTKVEQRQEPIVMEQAIELLSAFPGMQSMVQLDAKEGAVIMAAGKNRVTCKGYGDPELIDNFNSKNKNDNAQLTGEAPNYEDLGEYQFLIAINVFNHISKQDVGKILKNFRGSFIIFEASEDGINQMRQSEWIGVFKDHGWNLQAVDYPYSPFLKLFSK